MEHCDSDFIEEVERVGIDAGISSAGEMDWCRNFPSRPSWQPVLPCVMQIQDIPTLWKNIQGNKKRREYVYYPNLIQC